MNILALDTSVKSTGWAVYDGEIDYGTRSFQEVAREGIGPLMSTVYGFVVAASMDGIDLIAIETPHMRGPSTFPLMAMYNAVLLAAYDEQIPVIDRHSRTIKKFITGNGNAKKSDVVHVIKDRGFDVRNDDEADALALLSMVIHEKGLKCVDSLI